MIGTNPRVGHILPMTSRSKALRLVDPKISVVLLSPSGTGKGQSPDLLLCCISNKGISRLRP